MAPISCGIVGSCSAQYLYFSRRPRWLVAEAGFIFHFTELSAFRRRRARHRALAASIMISSDGVSWRRHAHRLEATSSITSITVIVLLAGVHYLSCSSACRNNAAASRKLSPRRHILRDHAVDDNNSDDSKSGREMGGIVMICARHLPREVSLRRHGAVAY